MPVTGNCNGVIGTAMLVWQDPVVMSADKCQLIHGSDAQLMKQYMQQCFLFCVVCKCTAGVNPCDDNQQVYTLQFV